MIRPNLELYHCNDSNRCYKFVYTKHNMIVSEEDGKWLGTGMYFWDNLANARFWMKKKERDCPSEVYRIVMANVYMDRLLDLTDQDICNKIGEIWEKYQKINYLDDKKKCGLGCKLNILFGSIPHLQEKYHVIKVNGKYNRTPENSLWSYNIKNDFAEPIGSVKCIYSVRNEEAIAEKKFVGKEVR